LRRRADAGIGGRRDERARTSAVRELNARGHDVVGLTRQTPKTPQIEQAGAKPVVADVFDAGQINSVVADIEPEVVVSLLTTLPKRGPMRVKDFEPARALWGRGAPNLVAAAQRAGVRRVVAESVIFAYGYPSSGPAKMDESDPYPGPPPPGGAEMLAALRRMEQTVLTSGEHSDTEGIVLRYGIFYGPDVPHTQMFTRLTKLWAMPAVTGKGIVSWIHIDDVAKATADSLDRGRGGQIYNIVDDRRSRSVTTSASCPGNCTGRGLCRCHGDFSGSSPLTGRSRSATPGCRCRTRRPRPTWAGRRSRVTKRYVLGADPHVEHQCVCNGEHDRRQPRRMYEGQRCHLHGHRRVVGVV